MFCRQCEQTARGEGCSVKGVCGKTSDVATLQDLLIHGLKGVAVYGKLARELGLKDKEIDLFLTEGLFTTVTNVNFDPQKITGFIGKSYQIRENTKTLFLGEYKKKNNKDFQDKLPGVVDWKPADTLEGLVEQGKDVGILADPSLNEDIRSLREILLYGLKGMAAYANHAYILGEEDEEVSSFFYKGLSALVDDTLEVPDLVNLVMEFGKANLRCLEILDKAHTQHFGHPVPTRVEIGVRRGPAIIVSGHDLLDLKELLEQTKDKGINIYTHGEMLPAHGYPGLKKYNHLIGHFGTAWQNQQKEFDNIPAVVLMTTNCIQEPRASYKDRIFTTGLVAWPQVAHIEGQNGQKDFSSVIEKAQSLGGFKEEKKEKEILVGFAHNTVLGVAGKVLELVKQKKINHFFLIGGCDGAKPGRNYYTEFAQKAPSDSLILTLACGKFRFNTLDFGEIEGIPRLLDCGQCNDAYSAIQIALALASNLGCGVNDLPLSLILSWYEQKAVCILLTLFSLGIKNIKLGPTLPAFVSSGVLKVLVDQFNVAPVSSAEEDLRGILGKEAKLSCGSTQ
ncbi:hydroxylamine reductase [Candidatus Omnitrophota bacterium]